VVPFGVEYHKALVDFVKTKRILLGDGTVDEKVSIGEAGWWEVYLFHVDPSGTFGFQCFQHAMLCPGL
jgi:hypothetical protein